MFCAEFIRPSVTCLCLIELRGPTGPVPLAQALELYFHACQVTSDSQPVQDK